MSSTTASTTTASTTAALWATCSTRCPRRRQPTTCRCTSATRTPRRGGAPHGRSGAGCWRARDGGERPRGRQPCGHCPARHPGRCACRDRPCGRGEGNSPAAAATSSHGRPRRARPLSAVALDRHHSGDPGVGTAGLVKVAARPPVEGRFLAQELRDCKFSDWRSGRYRQMPVPDAENDAVMRQLRPIIDGMGARHRWAAAPPAEDRDLSSSSVGSR